MFKTLESKWNARTPKILHNGSKQNLIAQFTLLILFMLGMEVESRLNERRFNREYVRNYPNT